MSETVQGQIQWLVRKAGGLNGSQPQEAAEDGAGLTTLVVLGPYLTDQVRLMVQQGMLEADDELCPENGYWFTLHESGELKKFLGIDYVARRMGPDDEATQPDIEVTQPDIVMEAEAEVQASHSSNPESTAMIQMPKAAGGKPQAKPPQAKPAQAPAPAAKAAPAKPAQPATAEELSKKFERQITAPPPPLKSPAQANGGEVSKIMGVEKGKLWSLLLGIAIAGAAIGIYILLKSLRA
jgi:hypothetical protein